MATKTSTQDLANLVINKVESQTAYDQMVAAGQINTNELYLVEGDVVPSPYTSNPAMDGTASPGSSSDYAKGDHVHPSDTSRAPVSHATSTSTYGEGTGTDYGHLRLSDSTSSTSGTSGGYAATPSAVKSAYDLANGKQDPLSATQLVWYGTSTTGATTQTKTTSITGISSLTSGLCVRIKFSNAQNYNGQPRLQINSLTATNIVRMGTTAAARYEWQAGEVVDFVYDGSNFVIQDGAIATTTYYGQTVLYSGTDSTSESMAATAKAVNTVYSAIPSASTTSPSMDGNASYGSGTTWARADHVHPTDTSRAPTSHSSSATTYGTGTSSNYGHVKLSDSTSSTSGVSGGVAATPAAVKSVMDSIPTVPTATATTPKMDGTAAVGSETQWAKGDHVHPTDTSRAPTSHATNATTYGAGTGTNYGHLRLSDSTSSTSSTSGGYAATPAAVKAAYDLANGKANTYSKTFTSTGWTSQTITVTASTHGCGTAPMVQVQRLNGSNYETYYGFPSTGWKVSIDTSGNVTLSVPASGDEFSGRLVIR